MRYSHAELKKRAFDRTAQALYSFWEEQQDNEQRTVAVHSRIFETLIYNQYIELNQKSPDRKYPEHVVPCAYIRNHAFDMFWSGRSIDDVASMIERLLHIAYISNDEQKRVDAINKDTMPEDWDPETDSILRRLEDADVDVTGMKD